MRFLLVLILLFLTTTIKAEYRIKIAIIDTGISLEQLQSNDACTGEHFSFVDEGILDKNSHGTNIMSIISKQLVNLTHCIVSYKAFDRDGYGRGLTEALRNISYDDSIKYINISSGGAAFDYTQYFIIKSLLDRGAKIIVAAGNDSFDLNKYCYYHPACYGLLYNSPNFYVVGSTSAYSNRGIVITDVLDGDNKGIPPMSGTSQATARKTGELVGGGIE